MKTLVKTLAVVVAVVATMSVNGQERVNGSQKNYTNQSQILTKAIGWEYNKNTHQWIKHKNMLAPFKMANAMQWGIYPNFQKIQIKQITYNDTNYYVIFIYYTGGAYKYPYLKEGFYQTSEKWVFLINEENYKRLFDLNNNISKIYGKQILLGYFSDEYYEIIRNIPYVHYENYNKTALEYEIKFNTFLNVYKSNDGSIRFLINPLNDNDIKDRYYEVSQEEWNKLEL